MPTWKAMHWTSHQATAAVVEDKAAPAGKRAPSHHSSSSSSYRCRTRHTHQPFGTDPALDGFIQLKARNASEAMHSARLVAPRECVVVDVERLDG